MSQVLGKEHTIRVQQSKSDATIERQDWSVYENVWARDLVEWLQYAPAWTHKVALIERIERMNVAWLNALLKSFEEPLEWRLIIATTSDATQLMDTIRSRAMIVHMGTVTDSQVDAILTQEFPELKDQERKAIISYAAWRIGTARELATDWSRRWALATVYEALRAALTKQDLVWAFTAMKQRLKEVWSVQSLLDLIQRIVWEQANGLDHPLMQRCVQAKRIAQSNVNDESLVFRVSCAFHDSLFRDAS